MFKIQNSFEFLSLVLIWNLVLWVWCLFRICDFVLRIFLDGILRLTPHNDKGEAGMTRRGWNNKRGSK